jgi:hypothetical protein
VQVIDVAVVPDALVTAVLAVDVAVVVVNVVAHASSSSVRGRR